MSYHPHGVFIVHLLMWLGAKFVLLSTCGIVAALGILTFASDNPTVKALLGHTGVDPLSKAKYAVLGGASRFLDAFDGTSGNIGVNEFSGGSQGPNQHGFNTSDDLDFIEAEQHVSKEIVTYFIDRGSLKRA